MSNELEEQYSKLNNDELAKIVDSSEEYNEEAVIAALNVLNKKGIKKEIKVNQNKATIDKQSKKGLEDVFILLFGLLLHVIFCAEGIFYPYNWKQFPVSCFASMLGYSLAGILASIVVIYPFVHYIFKNKSILSKLNLAIYIGLVIRISSYFIN